MMLLMQATDLWQLLASVLTKDNIAYIFLLGAVGAIVWYYFKYQLPSLKNSNKGYEETIVNLIINELKNSREVTVESLSTLKELTASIQKLSESIQISQHEHTLLSSNMMDKLNTVTTIVLNYHNKAGNGVDRR